MCGRYLYVAPEERAVRRFGVSVPAGYQPSYNAAPGQPRLVVPDDAPCAARLMTWGLVPPWAGPDWKGPPPINARTETAAEKPTFRAAWAARRCLVPADGWYEWEGARGRKTPWRVFAPDGDSFAFAAIWEMKEGLETFAILTTAAAPGIARLHPRMPAALKPERERDWLSPAPPDPAEFAAEWLRTDFEAREASPRVNNVANDDPSVLEPPPKTGSLF